VTDRPILFSAPMILALLAGRKTQTRRLAGKWRVTGDPASPQGETGVFVPSSWQRAQPGDRLWVRETWGCPEADRPGVKDGRKPRPGDRIVLQADPADAAQWQTGHPSCGGFVWRPAIHMPRWASRLTLLVTEVRRQRLQEMSEADAWAEGVSSSGPLPGHEDDTNAPPHLGAAENFAALWNHLHGTGAWDANPEVVALTFTVHHRNIDA
jgi:hypothetical protein